MFILFLICLVFLFLSCLQHRNLWNPGTLFYGLWVLIIGFRMLNLYSLYEISTYTIEMFGLGLLFWGIGCFGAGSVSLKIENRIINGRGEEKYNRTANKKVLLILCVITYALLGILAIRGFSQIRIGLNLANIRYELRNEIMDTDLLSILYGYFCVPMSYVLIHINMYSVFREKNSRWRYIVPIVFIILSRTLIEGGRFIVYYAAVDAIVLYFYSKNDVGLSKRARRIGLGAVVALIIVFTVISKNRGILGNFGEHVYAYLCGCINFFDAKLSVFNNYGFTYGATSLHGFVRPIFVVFRKLGLINNLPELLQVSEHIQYEIDLWTYISPTYKYNGFTSLFYDFYADGGSFCVCLFSFVWGIICKTFYKKIDRIDLERNVVFYLMITQAIFSSMLKFQFIGYGYALAYFYLLLIYSKRDYGVIEKEIVE